MDLTNKKKFAKAELNKDFEIFIVDIVVLKVLLSGLSIYVNRKAQIAFLLTKKIIISNKYSDFANIFSKKRF